MVKKVVTTREELDGSEKDEQEQEPTPEEIELDDFFKSIGASANRVKVYKIVDGEKHYCGAAEPSAMNEDIILKRWGGGKYFLQALKNNKYVPGGVRTINLYAPEETTEIFQGAFPGNPGGFNGGNPEIALLREQIAQQNTLIMNLMQSMITGGQKEQSSVTELAQAMRELHALNPPAVNPAESLKPILELTGKMMEMATSSGDDDPKMKWLKFAESVIEKVPAMLGQLAPVVAARIMSKGGNAMAGNGADPKAKLQAMLKSGIGFLKDKAAKGKDWNLYVDMILDNIDDEEYKPFLGLLNYSNEEILKLDPELEQEPYKAWFTALFTGIKEGISDAGQIDAGESGGGANAGPDETVDNSGDIQPGSAEQS